MTLRGPDKVNGSSKQAVRPVRCVGTAGGSLFQPLRENNILRKMFYFGVRLLVASPARGPAFGAESSPALMVQRNPFPVQRGLNRTLRRTLTTRVDRRG